MPYIEGKPLTEALGRDRLASEAQAAALIRKLALALQEAHAKGVIHRDLKPGNIMINRRKDLVIMDFGLARMAGGEDGVLTRTGNVLGTALYMAPEQAAGDIAAIGPAADVYSLGVILFELLTGDRPFEGPWSLVIGLKNVKDPDPPSKHRPDLSPALDAICLKALAQKPEDRYRTMAELAEVLTAFLAIASVPAPAGTPAKTSHSAGSQESPASQSFTVEKLPDHISLLEEESFVQPSPNNAKMTRHPGTRAVERELLPSRKLPASKIDYFGLDDEPVARRSVVADDDIEPHPGRSNKNVDRFAPRFQKNKKKKKSRSMVLGRIILGLAIGSAGNYAAFTFISSKMGKVASNVVPGVQSLAALETILKERFKLNQELAAILSAVADMNSATAASGPANMKVRAISANLRKLKTAKVLKKDLDALTQQYTPMLDSSTKLWVEQFFRIAQIPGATDALNTQAAIEELDREEKSVPGMRQIDVSDLKVPPPRNSGGRSRVPVE